MFGKISLTTSNHHAGESGSWSLEEMIDRTAATDASHVSGVENTITRTYDQAARLDGNRMQTIEDMNQIERESQKSRNIRGCVLVTIGIVTFIFYKCLLAGR